MDEEQNYKADEQYTLERRRRTKKEWARRKTIPGDGETTNCSPPLLESLPMRSL